MGSIFHLPVEVAEDFQGRLSALKQAGVRLLGGHLRGTEAMPGRQEKLCVIIGNEARGMSESAARLCDYLVKIPIYGKAESLNAAVEMCIRDSLSSSWARRRPARRSSINPG